MQWIFITQVNNNTEFEVLSSKKVAIQSRGHATQAAGDVGERRKRSF